MDNCLKYPNLFKPLRVGNTVFRNRIFSAPTGLYDLTPERAPTDDYIAYFERKAKGGCASVNIGECYVDHEGIPSEDYEVIHLKDHKGNYAQLGKLADAINRNGAVATIELQKPGMASSQASEDDVLLGPSDGVCEFNSGIKCRGMTEEEIYKTIDAFAEAAVYAKNRGFGMVMVHAGHGWLLHQFLSPYTNKRTDKWGGSIENRARFTVAVVDEIHKRCGRNFPVEVRMSGSEIIKGGFDINDGIEIAKQLDGHADIIHVSVGNIFADEITHLTHPGIFEEEAMNVKYAAEIKKHVKCPVATIGALTSIEVLEDIIASGKADIVEMARGLICEPDLPTKGRDGREKELRRCLRCFKCVRQDYQDGRLFCAINPASGKEREAAIKPTPIEKKKVLIAGGGIAGMEAAINAAEIGHEVILCEKSDRLGGVLNCERNVPFKLRIGDYIDRQAYVCEKRGVDIRLNTEVTPELCAELRPDVIVAAIGAETMVPPIPGIKSDHVKTATEVFSNPEKAEGKTLILGGGLSGLELGIYLRMLGREVEIVEMRGDEAKAESSSYQRKLREVGIDVRYETRAAEILPDGVKVIKNGEESIIPCNTVVNALGMRPLFEETDALSDCAPQFYRIGDCRMARDIKAATSEAWTVSRGIGCI